MVDQKDMSPRQARAVLGLGRNEAIDPAALTRAYRAAVKAAHPDRPGGDAARLRRVLAAHALLKARAEPATDDAPADQPAAPAPIEEAPVVLTLSPAEAARGGEILTDLADGRTLRIRAPAGLRPGDRLRAGETVLTIEVRTEADIALRGDDLWLTRALPADAPRGGRLAVETPDGPVMLWIGRQALDRGLVRLSGRGLPARGRHAAGDMFVRLAPAPAVESAARGRLRAFAQAWAG
jgi:curved DNA-binding protein